MWFQQRRSFAAACIVAAAAAGCGRTIKTYEIPQDGQASRSFAEIQRIAGSLPSADYRLGPGDVVEIKVFGIKDLDTTVRIPESGVIDFPLAGNTQTTGKTAAEVEASIAKALSERYINDPHVMVFIKEFNSYRVSVVGAVVKPGMTVLKKGNCTLVDALAEAGGLGEKAGTQVFVTTRAGLPESRVQVVDLRNLLEKGDLAENVGLAPGDSIYVPECGYVFVSGHVQTPGAYPLRKDMTALQSISAAGDFTSTASRRVRLIRRISPAKVEVRKVNLSDVSVGDAADVSLEPSDVIEAEASLWKVPVYGTVDFIKAVLGVSTSIK